MFLGCPVLLSDQILLSLFHLMNGLNNFDKNYREYSLFPTNDLVRFWGSKVKVTPWFTYTVAKVT